MIEEERRNNPAETLDKERGAERKGCGVCESPGSPISAAQIEGRNTTM